MQNTFILSMECNFDHHNMCVTEKSKLSLPFGCFPGTAPHRSPNWLAKFTSCSCLGQRRTSNNLKNQIVCARNFSSPFGLDSVRHHRRSDRGDNDVHHGKGMQGNREKSHTIQLVSSGRLSSSKSTTNGFARHFDSSIVGGKLDTEEEKSLDEKKSSREIKYPRRR